MIFLVTVAREMSASLINPEVMRLLEMCSTETPVLGMNLEGAAGLMSLEEMTTLAMDVREMGAPQTDREEAKVLPIDLGRMKTPELSCHRPDPSEEKDALGEVCEGT